MSPRASNRFQNPKAAPLPKMGMAGFNTQPGTISFALDGPFSEWLGPHDWEPWRAFLSALFGERLSKKHRKIYQACTGRKDQRLEPYREAWCIAGRRARKSAIAAVIAVYLGVYGQWQRAKGETVRILVIAVSKNQAAIIKNYALAILESHPALARMVKSSDQWRIELTNGLEIFVATNSFRSIRGPTVVCAIFEEVAFWHDDNSANPDTELFRAVKPSMLTVPNGLILGISSPYARRGLLWERYKAHFGKEGSNVLVWQASTQIMHPAVDADEITQAYKEDPEAARAEYGGEFRSDIETFLSIESIEAVTERGIPQRAYDERHRYFGFVDPSGGVRDAMVVAIAHHEAGRIILDLVQERKPPFSPESVVADFAAILRAYRISIVRGDAYGGIWPISAFEKNGITYRKAEKSKNDLYRELLAPISSGKVSLIDNEKLKAQLVALERRLGRGGRDIIDHAPNAHDDAANAVAGVIDLVLTEQRKPRARLAATAPIIIKDPPRVIP